MYGMHHGMFCKHGGCQAIQDAQAYQKSLGTAKTSDELSLGFVWCRYWEAQHFEWMTDDSINKVGSPFPTSGVLSLIEAGTNWQGLCLASVVTE